MIDDRAMQASSKRASCLAPASDRHGRLLHLLQEARSTFGADATALLELTDDRLMPAAVDGLREEILGRCFRIEQQPVLERILRNRDPVRSIATGQPDPYDGLLNGYNHDVGVHDCLGSVLLVDDRPWGMLTMDAIRPGTFSRIDPTQLRAFLTETEQALKECMPELSQSGVIHHPPHDSPRSPPRVRKLMGTSDGMVRLWGDLKAAADTDRSVLILGETGVGKELVTHWLYENSTRAGQPLVIVNCAALPLELADSELFGHHRGAFTGASDHRRGKFEQAHGGTLVLGELPASIQPKLLRVLQSGEIQRPGSDQLHRVDVRVIAATNRDLLAQVQAGSFRADLYYRLCGISVTVASLRERADDVLVLAGFFLEEIQQRMDTPSLRLTENCRRALLAYRWPGNVRELENVMVQAAARAVTEQGRHSRWIRVGVEHLPLVVMAGTPSPAVLAPDLAIVKASKTSLSAATDEFQRAWILREMARGSNNISSVARTAGMDPRNLSRLMKRLGLR